MDIIQNLIPIFKEIFNDEDLIVNSAITTKDNREILGEYIKGKLEREGHLERLETITLDTLRNYGRDYISLKKIKDKTYYLEF